MRNIIFILLVFSGLFFTACGDDPTPKPIGYFRIAIPEHHYIKLDSNKYPFTFEYADYSVVNNANNSKFPYWCYIDYPNFKARIYLTYKKVDGNINQMLTDAHELAYKHISVANDIKQDLIIEPQKKVYGLMYEIKGAKVASPLNFFLTDSINNFVRGALYFNMKPQNDSIAPVIKGIKKDLVHIINTFEWRDIR